MVLVRGVEPPFTRSSFQTKRSVGRGSSDCFHGSRFFDIGREPRHPPMHDSKAVSLAILMTDAFSGPTADGIDDVGGAFDGTEAIPQTVPEGVDDTSIRHT